MKKEAWLVRWEAEVAKWKKSPTGQATTALYAAAAKAGFEDALRRIHVEVCVSTYQGKTSAYAEWDLELQENDAFEFTAADEAVFARAQAWTKKYAAARGWEV
jgi:hypothetical protein